MRVFREVFFFLVLWDSLFPGSELFYFIVWELINLSLRSPNQCLLYYSIMSDTVYLVVLICVAHYSFLLSHYLDLIFHHFFPSIYSLFHAIPTPIYFLDSTLLFTSFTWLVDGLTTSPPFSFHHRCSHWPLLSSHAHEIFLCVVHYTRGYGFDHWVFDPSFLSFLCLLTLAYVTSRVLRPP